MSEQMIQANSIASEKVCDHPSTEKAVASLEEFFKWAIREGPWDGCDLDGASVQDKAESLGLIIKTQYKPEIHGQQSEFEVGDDYFVFSPAISTASLIAHPANLHGRSPETNADLPTAEDVRGILSPSLLGRETVREALEKIAEFCSEDATTLGAIKRLAQVREVALAALASLSPLKE